MDGVSKTNNATEHRNQSSSVASIVIVIIIMGKKSKANRKKPPVATTAAAPATATAAPATATAAPAPATAAVVASAEATATATETRRGEFPESTFLLKGAAFRKKGNHAKAQKYIFPRNRTWLCPMFERIYRENDDRWRNNRECNEGCGTDAR